MLMPPRARVGEGAHPPRNVCFPRTPGVNNVWATALHLNPVPLWAPVRLQEMERSVSLQLMIISDMSQIVYVHSLLL